MSMRFPADYRHCATCAFWCGVRETNYFGEWADVESSMAKGKCMGQFSGYTGRDTPANYWCSKYEKWPALKR